MILITGAAGLIGSALVWHYNRAGRSDLILVDAPAPAAPRDEAALAQAREKTRNLAGLDFADYWGRDELLARAREARPMPALEAVVHLGACSDTTESDGEYLLRNNFAYSRDLARWSLERGVRFVYASSAATYGGGERGYEDDAAQLPRLRPLNPYGVSKQAMDLWALRSGALERVAAVKYFNVYGPNEYHKGAMRSMALKAWEQLRAQGRVRLFRSERPEFADGEQRRDFLYVKDAVAATAWLAEARAANGVFNLGYGASRTWNDLARAVAAAVGGPAQIEYFDMPAELRGQYQYDTCAPMDRLRRAGGPAPRWELETAVKDYVGRYLAAGRLRLQDVEE